MEFSLQSPWREIFCRTYRHPGAIENSALLNSDTPISWLLLLTPNARPSLRYMYVDMILFSPKPPISPNSIEKFTEPTHESDREVARIT
jgi:hypothetical protein